MTVPTPRTKTVPPEVQDVLNRSTVADGVLRLPEQLPRADYVAVDKVLKGLGGKWNRKTGGHAFPFDPSTLIRNAVDDGTYQDRKHGLQFFETPMSVANDMVDLADINPSDRVLEPSAGCGALVVHALAHGAGHVHCVEIDAHNISVLGHRLWNEMASGRVSVTAADFLEYARVTSDLFDVVVMNPPFSGGQDMTHIRTAWRLLEPEGRLVSVCGEGALFRSDRAASEFREWLAETNAEVRQLPDGTFRSSGTNVRARLVKVQRRAA